MRLFPKRKIKLGDHDKWVLWRWTDIGDASSSGTVPTRLTVFRCPWFQVIMCWITGPDPGVEFHDHPWAFVGVVLDGGYTEATGEVCDDMMLNTKFNKVSCLIKKTDPTVADRIMAAEDHTVTLIITGPVRKPWSYFTPVGSIGHGDVKVIQTPYEL